MRKFEAGSEDWLRKYLQKEEPYNVYMLSNLENYGLNDCNVEFLHDEKDGMPIVVLMRFFNSFVIYSDRQTHDFDDVISEIRLRSNAWNALSCLTGKMSCVKRIAKEDAVVRHTHILVYNVNQHHLKRTGNNENIHIFDRDSLDMIAEHYRRVPEMADKYGNDEADARRDILCNLESGRLFGLMRNGRIVSSIMTTAESKERAMLINVCTVPEYRGKGMCSYILEYSCDALFSEGLSSVYIYYENENAGNIYKKAGFRFYGDYGRVSIKDIRGG